MGGLQCNVMQAPESAMLGILMHDEDESDGAYVDDVDDGVHQKSHKHFIPYMVFCASIWDNVRHHCHRHHHHHRHNYQCHRQH